MAVTGNGTKENPFIVHNYDEIQNWDTLPKDEGTVYLKLDNDIDCNDYGNTWEWTSIGVFNYKNEKQRSLDLDLNGHTIKNILIKRDSYLFSTGSTSTSSYFIDGTAKVHNGKILNIFNNSAYNLVNTNGFFTLFNLSISANIVNLQKDVFSRCRIENCSIYLKAGYWNTNNIFYTISEGDAILKNSDFLLDMKAPGSFYACTSALKTIADGCRIIQIGDAYEAAGSALRPFYSGRCNNCVFDVNYKNTSTNGSNPFGDVSSNVDNTGVYNRTHLTGVVNNRGMTSCTDAQIKSGDSLLQKNFAVIKED